MMQQGTYYKDIRYKFVHPIVLGALFKDSGKKDPDEIINQFMEFMHEVARNALSIVEFVFWVYVKERGITPL